MNLLPAEAAERLRISKGTMANWRTAGTGPRFLKSGRVVLYPETELAKWEQSCLRQSTTETSIEERLGDR